MYKHKESTFFNLCILCFYVNIINGLDHLKSIVHNYKKQAFCVYVIRQYVYISVSLKYCNCHFCVARAILFKFVHQGG